MNRIVLGKTGIEVSYLGLGTSAAYDGVVCSAKMDADDYPGLLRFGYEHGVTFWDTSLTYGTHHAIRETLKSVPRKDVVICSKTVESGAKKTEKAVERTLREIGTDYIDIFLMQCVRNKFEFLHRSNALETLCMMKEKGYIRAIGLASHGIGALEACRNSDMIDIVMGRVNYSGHVMDSRQEGLKSILAGIQTIKKISERLIPKVIFKALATSVQRPVASVEDRKTALKIFQELHTQGKSIIGIKILGEGHIANNVENAIRYVNSLPFITSIVVGCCSKTELIDVINAIDSPVLVNN
jgi:aryl-alcohol dehydrogenase-like predicted oxidoreductase